MYFSEFNLVFQVRDWVEFQAFLVQTWRATQDFSLLTRLMVEIYSSGSSQLRWVNVAKSLLTLSVRGLSYLGLIRSMSWLLMPWLLASPGHQLPWCKISKSLSYIRKDSNYLCHVNAEEWHKMWIYVLIPLKNLAHKGLTLWGWVMHICVGNLTIIGSDNGLSPGRRQAIIWTNAWLLLIETLGTIFSAIQAFSFKKMHLKMSYAKWHPFWFSLNVLTYWGLNVMAKILQKPLPPVMTKFCEILWHHRATVTIFQW